MYVDCVVTATAVLLPCMLILYLFLFLSFFSFRFVALCVFTFSYITLLVLKFLCIYVVLLLWMFAAAVATTMLQIKLFYFLTLFFSLFHILIGIVIWITFSFAVRNDVVFVLLINRQWMDDRINFTAVNIAINSMYCFFSFLVLVFNLWLLHSAASCVVCETNFNSLFLLYCFRFEFFSFTFSLSICSTNFLRVRSVLCNSDNASTLDGQYELYDTYALE